LQSAAIVRYNALRSPAIHGRGTLLATVSVRRLIPMKRGIVTLLVTFGFASSAHAAPGDPRLVQGVLEWPAKLTVEPFVVIRADDGRWYYAEVKGVKRLESSPLTSGARVAILGAEAARPAEITAIALGAGAAAPLALALMPHVNGPVAPAPTAVQSANAPKPVAAAEPSSKAEPSSASKAEPTSTPKTAAKSERPAATSPAAPPPAAAPVVAATPAPTGAPTPATATAPTVPPGAAASSTPATAPVMPPSTKAAAPVSDSPAPSAPRVVAAPTGGSPIGEKAGTEKAPEPTGDGPRWTELRGTIKVIAGNWIVV